MITQIRQHRLGQSLFDGAAEGLAVGLPVRATIEVWYGSQRIKRIAAIWRETGVQLRGPMQIETEILGQMVTLEDIAQQPLVSRTQEHRVLGHILVATIGTEVPDV